MKMMMYTRVMLCTSKLLQHDALHLRHSLLDVLLLGINATTPAPVAEQNCASNTSSAVILDRLLIIAPSWSSVQQDLTWTFLVHIYGFACLFFVLGFYTFFSILNLRYNLCERTSPFNLSLISSFFRFFPRFRVPRVIVSPFSGLSYQAGRS